MHWPATVKGLYVRWQWRVSREPQLPTSPLAWLIPLQPQHRLSCVVSPRSRGLATPRLAGRLRNTRSEPQRSCQTVMLWARRVGDAPCRQNCPGPETSRTVGPWSAYSLCLGFWQEVGHAKKLSVPQDVCLGYTIRPICQGYIHSKSARHLRKLPPLFLAQRDSRTKDKLMLQLMNISAQISVGHILVCFT